ncbi:hypothetical protein Hanom_Chr12g01171581 [Helianthus anomalus]
MWRLGRMGSTPPASRYPCIPFSSSQMGCWPCCARCMADLSSHPTPSGHRSPMYII